MRLPITDFDREKILGKLALIMENMKMLQYLKRLSLEEFIQDFRNVESAKHLLQVLAFAPHDQGKLAHQAVPALYATWITYHG